MSAAFWDESTQQEYAAHRPPFRRAVCRFFKEENTMVRWTWCVVLLMLCIGACARSMAEYEPRPPVPDEPSVIMVMGKQAHMEQHVGCGTPTPFRHSVHVYQAEDATYIACPFRNGCYPDHVPLDARGEPNDEGCVNYDWCIAADGLVSGDTSALCRLFYPDLTYDH
ncbi:MAG: hypothetical protein Q7T01_04395 [bacterium]|nr:hypothetical protein [bacterium]